VRFDQPLHGGAPDAESGLVAARHPPKLLEDLLFGPRRERLGIVLSIGLVAIGAASGACALL
jgi:hypothetical protein